MNNNNSTRDMPQLNWDVFVTPGKPAYTEYYPTEKGMAVQGILAEIASFSTKYEPEIIFVDKKPRNNMKALFGTRSLSEVYNF